MFDGATVRPPAAFNLVDLTKRGLEAHLQRVVLDVLVHEQLQAFERTLRQRLEQHVKGITIGHVAHVKDVLAIRDEILVKVDCEFHDVPQEAAQ